MIAVLLLGASLPAQEACDVEAKVLISVDQTQAAVAALNASKEVTGHVYFYDTDKLDLFSHGVIVRLRQGADNDLTVKLRPTAGQGLAVPSAGREGYKCEVDLTGAGAINSYSIKTEFLAQRLPAAGSEIVKLLSVAQAKLLEQSQVTIDWARVKRSSGIRYTAWQIKSQPGFKKLTLELWEWSGGHVLELSDKTGAGDGPATYAALQQLIKSRRLSLSRVQGPKTGIVLKRLAEAAAH
jgi:hypothetical protein